MRRQVALLRGINVGKAKRVAMAELRTLVEELGYTDVKTLLNSGNVVFTRATRGRDDAAARIEGALVTRLGVAARVIVLDAADIAAAVAKRPFGGVATDDSRLVVTVLRERGDRARLESLAAQSWAPERIALGERVAYLWCPDGLSRGKLFLAVDKALGNGGTSRNWATMLKLKAMVGAPASGSRAP
ncbi:MAG: DUF1697 domain-containing protein [Gemmatimonadaceae bacterium]